jgi:uncharacterized membrane protein YtjA (UPF0391 family)
LSDRFFTLFPDQPQSRGVITSLVRRKSETHYCAILSGGFAPRGPILKLTDAHCSQLMRFIPKGGENMLGWAVTFLIIALVAAVFGFGGIAAASAGIAKFLFFLFLVMCVIFFIFGWRGRGVP